MSDIFLMSGALLLTGWLVWPPRGDQRRWLLLGLLVLWGGIVGVGWRRGIMPGFVGWLVVLGLLGALVGLLVVWSVVTLLGRPKVMVNKNRTGSQD